MVGLVRELVVAHLVFSGIFNIQHVVEILLPPIFDVIRDGEYNFVLIKNVFTISHI